MSSRFDMSAKQPEEKFKRLEDKINSILKNSKNKRHIHQCLKLSLESLKNYIWKCLVSKGKNMKISTFIK
jgi:3-methyladenine DNA glycosylase Tag